MSYAIHHNEEEALIVVSFHGDLDLQNAREALQVAIALAVEKQCFLMLTDLREANMKLSVVDIFNLPGLVEEISARVRLNPRHFRRAIVVNGLEDMRFYETVFHNRGFPVMIFDDVEKAKAWLHALK